MSTLENAKIICKMIKNNICWQCENSKYVKGVGSTPDTTKTRCQECVLSYVKNNVNE